MCGCYILRTNPVVAVRQFGSGESSGSLGRWWGDPISLNPSQQAPFESQTWQWESKWNYVIILWELCISINNQINIHSNGNYVHLFVENSVSPRIFHRNGIALPEILRQKQFAGSEAKLLKSNEFSFYLNTDSNRPSALLWGGVDKVSKGSREGYVWTRLCLLLRGEEAIDISRLY